MAEVRVHFEEVRVALLQAPLETSDVGGAEAQLSGAFEQVDPPFVAILRFANEVGRAIR